MKYDGCAHGWHRSGDTCKKIELPKIGTARVPSVENREGCRSVGGRWMHEYGGVCVLHESCGKGICRGWTAPIKGAIVYWDYIDFYEVADKRNRDPEKKGVCMASVSANLVDSSNKRYKFAAEDPVFEMLVNEYYVTKSCHELRELSKDIGLSLAKMIKEGDAGKIGLQYVSPEGRPTSSLARNAVVTGWDERPVVDVYKIKPSKKPFRLRRGG